MIASIASGISLNDFDEYDQGPLIANYIYYKVWD